MNTFFTRIKIFTEKQSVKSIAAVLLPILLVSASYSNFTKVFFSRPDDSWMLLTNSLVSSPTFDWEYIKTLFTTVNVGQYSPVNTLYYFLIFKINAYNPNYYHLLSIIIHLVNVLLIHNLSLIILKSFEIMRADCIAYLVCIIWSIHPLNVESVIWISASKVILYGFFSMLSFMYFIRGFLNNKSRYFILSSVLFIVSCCCKEQSIVNPFMFLAFTCCYLIKNRKSVLEKKKWVVFSILNIGISIGFGLYFYQLTGTDSQAQPMISYSWFEKMNLTFYCLGFYVTNLFFPINLHFFYPFPFEPGFDTPMVIYAYTFTFISLSALVAQYVVASKNIFFYVLCIAIFFIQLILVLQIFPMTRFAIVADRYMYIPAFVLILIICTLVVNNFSIKHVNYRIVSVTMLAAYLVYFSSYSFKLVGNWEKLNLTLYKIKEIKASKTSVK